MALILTDDQNYKDIAAAIREKNGGTATYAPGEMAAAISAGASGGLYYHHCQVYISGSEAYQITFVDSYGTGYNSANGYLGIQGNEQKAVVIGLGYRESYLYGDNGALKLKYKTLQDGQLIETIIDADNFIENQGYPFAV